MSYKPLPDYLIIQESTIDGLGIFAIRTINKGLIMLGYPSHIILSDNAVIRTPLGGFINHSNNSNCALNNFGGYWDEKIYKSFLYCEPIRDIKVGEELTLDYTKELCGLHDYKDEDWLK